MTVWCVVGRRFIDAIFVNQRLDRRDRRFQREAAAKLPRPLVSVCSWCPDSQEQTANARANGFEVTHGMCEPCRVKFEAGR